MKAIRVEQPGGSEALKYMEVPTPEPGPGQILIRQEAIGLNFIDVYQREGRYPLATPFSPGNEGAGVVETVGEGVTRFSPGDRVAHTMTPGAYGDYMVIDAGKAVTVPEGMETTTAAAIMLQGTTAHYLVKATYPLKPGERCLIHAGAGGVGLLLIQMAKMCGAEVYTTVSTPEKAKLAQGAGADHVILYTEKDFVEETLALSGGAKLDVVYDSVGKDTYVKGLDLLRPRGMMVLFGMSSGPVPPIDLSLLGQKGSLFTTRPSLAHHLGTREELEMRAGEVMDWVKSDKLKVHIGATYPLSEAKAAHDDLEGRKTTGKVLLIP